MRAYHIAAASVAMCSGLIFASYLKAAEINAGGQIAQMNRAGYLTVAETDPAPLYVPPRRPHQERPAVVAQMNRAQYAKPSAMTPKTAMTLPRRPFNPSALQPASAQMNRVLYDR